MKGDPPSILFLCTGNSCRSQMAEGWMRNFHGSAFNIFSAGIEAHGLNPKAVQVMKEAGIEISQHKSQTVDELPVVEFDYVVTVCSNAEKSCPFFPAKTKLMHHNFDDPPRLAKEAETEEEAIGIYRRVSDEIKEFTRTLPQEL